MHQKLGFGQGALGGIHSSFVRPPIRSGPQGRLKGGVPLRKGGRGVPWQEEKWKEKLGSTRAGGQAASGPPGQAAVTQAHWCVGLVYAWVGLTPSYCWGAAGSPPRGKSGSPRGPQREALATPGLTPPPGGLAPAPRPRPPGPPFHPRARCSAGGGIGWGRGAEAAAGTTSLPAASLCARGASGGGERAGERAAARARRGEGERARRGGCEAAPAAALRPPPGNSAPAPRAVRAVPPPPPGPRRLPSQAGVWLGQGSPPGDWGTLVQRSPRGAPIALQRPPAELRGKEGGGAPWRPEGRTPRLLRRSPNPGERTERARSPSALDLALIPCVPHFCTNFSDALARGGRGERWAACWAPAPRDPSHADLLPLVASVATSPGRAGHGTRGERGNPGLLSQGSRAPWGSRAG